MAELSIDQSKLPGVKEVCRDFAVLEDHTLAHNLQEQEIEHHLATNIQRNRLVQYDLQMAKQLQEEEDLKARVRIQERHKDMERQDCEIAQEIQVKLVIEAEQRRRQEEDDEGIARILQQKELQEEKRRKKPHPDPLRHGTYEESSRDPSRSSSRERALEHAKPRRPRSGDRHPQRQRERQRGPPLVSEGLDLEVLGSSSEARKAKYGRRLDREKQDRKPRSLEKSKKPPLDPENEYVEKNPYRSKESWEKTSATQERTGRPPSLLEDGEPERPAGASRDRRERSPRSRERRQRPPLLLVDSDQEDDGAGLDPNEKRRKHRERPSSSLEKGRRPQHLSADVEERRPGRRCGSSCSPSPDRRRRPSREGQNSPRPSSRDHRLPSVEEPGRQSHRRHAGKGSEGAGGRTRASPSSHRGADWESDARRHQNPGSKSRATKEALYQKPRPVMAQDQELYDAEIARRLQEEELLASQVDKRAAQVAQDEEIARLLLEEEKKAYKKSKEREKFSSEKKRQEQDWKHDPQELGRPRSREGHEAYWTRSDKPTRLPPPPSEDLDHLCSLTSQQNLAHQISKPEPSHKGYHYKQ